MHISDRHESHILKAHSGGELGEREREILRKGKKWLKTWKFEEKTIIREGEGEEKRTKEGEKRV